jgi:catechol 2,3-dioxygenase-like lactoylglutathione lyase family enzyme
MLGQARVGATIPVSDRERAKDFYTGTLGLTVQEETGSDVMFAAGDGTGLGAYETPHAGTAQHALAAFLVDDLDATMAALRERGVTFEEYDLPGLKTENGVAVVDGERGAWFKDPDGNILAIGERTGAGA